MAYFAGALLCLEASRNAAGFAALWVPNAVAICALMLGRSEQRVAYATACTVASVAANAAGGMDALLCIVFTLANIATWAIAVAALRRFGVGPDAFETRAGSGKFVLALTIATAPGATLAAGVLATRGVAFGEAWLSWLTSDILGSVLISAFLLTVLRLRGDPSARSESASRLTFAATMLVVTAVSTAVFLQSRFPLLFLPLIAVLFATFRLGRIGAVGGTLIVAVTGLACLAFDRGPVSLVDSPMATRILFFQFYLTAIFATCLPVGVVLAERRRMEGALRESEGLYRLIAENSNDMIVRLDLQGVRKYVSPASVHLLGYEPHELVGLTPAGEIHPDDRATVVATCLALIEGDTQAMCVYRQRRKDGVYIWLEASYRLIRDDRGAPVEAIASVRDVSRREVAELERERAAAQMRESHRLLMMAEEMGQIGHWRLDLASQTVFWSDAVCAIHGVPRGHVPALETAIEFYHPDDRDATARLVGRALADGKDFANSARIVRPDGSIRHVISQGRAEKAPDGTIIGLFGVFQDVTAAEQARVKLDDSNRLLKMAESVARLGHWRIDVHTRALLWSDEVFAIYGLPRDTVPTVEGTLALYHPDDVDAVRRTVDRALAAGNGYTSQSRIIRPDGKQVHILSRCEVDRDADGDVVGFFGIVQDVTEQREAERLLAEREARFRLITEQASDMISLHGIDGRCLFMSPAAVTILGYEPEQMLGTTPYDYAPAEDHPALDRQRAELQTIEPGAVSSVRFRMRRRDGDLIWVEVAARLIRMDDEASIIAVCRNVTAQVSAEAELREARIAAEAAAAAKSAFLATMSHEIRTPMTGVLGMVELLRSDVDPAQRDRFFNTLEQSAKTLMAVLDDVLDYAKIEAGNLTLETVDFDLAALAHSVGDLFGNAASAKGLTLTVQAPPARIAVQGDPTRIRQILSNLVSNAIKFTDTGGVTVAIATAQFSARGDRWRIEVIDSGIGIDPADSGTLFSPFVQADVSTTRRFGGTGLGLSISKRLANAMGGEIGVGPRDGGGSVFWFELPLSASPSQAVEPSPRAAERAKAGEVMPRMRVLVAEDNEVNQLLLTALLRRMGHEVMCVGNGALALAESENGYDVILMDMQMPVMDGVAATRAIRSLPGAGAAIPIIALTADALPERRRFYENIGLTDFLTKPIDVDRLTAVLRALPPPPARETAQEAAAIDPNRLADLRAVVGEETVGALLAMIGCEASRCPAAVRGLLDAGGMAEAAAVAHALYGAASNVGATRLAAAARAIERADDLDAASLELAELDAAAEALIASLAPEPPIPNLVEYR